MKSFSAALFTMLFTCAALLTSCGEKASDPTPSARVSDAFLGTWKAESMRSTHYQANGQVVVGQDRTYQHSYVLEACATTFITYQADANPRTTDSHDYVRQGDQLTVSNWPATWRFEARDLTGASMTYVLTIPTSIGGTRVQTVVYHR